MKHLKHLFTALLLLCCIGMAKAEVVTIDGIKYDVVTKAKQATVIQGGNYSGDIVIPSEITYNNVIYSVTSIGNRAFWDCSRLTSITIPNSVTSIGERAFWGCLRLTSITIHNSVTSIGDSAFGNCSGLTSVTIGNSVTSIGDSAFYACSGLTSIVVEVGNQKYDSRENCNAIIETESNTLIAGCMNTVIPNSVTSIGKEAFFCCTRLTSIEIPNSVTSIGNYAFYNCGGLTSIEIPNSVTSIGENAFSSCSGLTSIEIPNSVTSIGDYAFSGCSGLTSVTIGNSVTSIGGGAFEVSGLTSITIPNSVTSIGSYAFNACSRLTSIVVEVGNQKYDSRENCNAIIETESNTLIAGCMNTEIPNSVTSIGEHAFSNCDGLTSITIPNSVTSIGDEAFFRCSELTSVTIPNSVTSIGSYAFYKCSGLTSIEIPNSVTSIGDVAFYGCQGLTSITIPNSVTSIGRSAFYECTGLTSVTIGTGVESIDSEAFAKCSNLTDVYCLATSVPSTNTGAFNESYPEYMTLHVPAEAINSYKTTSPWSSFGNIVALKEEIVETPKCATPVIKYNNGKLSLECDTENAEIVTKITSNDVNSFYGNTIELSATYNISVYATAAGYENSDTINATLCWVECDCDANVSTDIIDIPAKALLVTSNNGTINITCSLEGESVELYTSDAMFIKSTTIENGCATIESGLSKGDIAIVKIGEKSIKIIID